MPKTFKGHGVLAMVINVILAFWPLCILGVIELNRLTGATPIVFVMTGMFFMVYPHPIYLFFEIKHLVTSDGIAEPLDLSAILVFGFQSLIGLTLQIVTDVMIVKYFNLSGTIVVITLISFLAVFGGCLGLTDLVWLNGLWPPNLIYHSLLVIKNWRLVAVLIGTTTLLVLLTIPFV